MIKNFTPEYQIKGSLYKNSKFKNNYQTGDKIPDGIFTLFINDKLQLVALELDLSFKSKKRYDNIFTKHLFTKNWDAIFYIVKDVLIRDKLLSHLKEVKRKSFVLKTEKNLNAVYFCLLDEFLEKKNKAFFVDDKIEFTMINLEKSVLKKIF